MINVKNIKSYILSILVLLFVLLVYNTAYANEKENIFPSQNCLEVELAKLVEGFMFINAISENDFSSKKSYIRLGEVECVGKVGRVAAKGAVKYSGDLVRSAGKNGSATPT